VQPSQLAVSFAAKRGTLTSRTRSRWSGLRLSQQSASQRVAAHTRRWSRCVFSSDYSSTSLTCTHNSFFTPQSCKGPGTTPTAGCGCTKDSLEAITGCYNCMYDSAGNTTTEEARRLGVNLARDSKYRHLAFRPLSPVPLVSITQPSIPQFLSKRAKRVGWIWPRRWLLALARPQALLLLALRCKRGSASLPLEGLFSPQ